MRGKDKKPMLPVTPVKAIAYENLPTKERWQHHEFEIGGTGPQEIPVAQVRLPMVYDLLFEEKILNLSQKGAGVVFVAAKEAALGLRRTPPRQSEEASQVDVYYAIVRALPKKQFRMVEIGCQPIAPDENLKLMRFAMYRLKPHLREAFDWLEEVLEEIYGCKKQ